MNKTNSPKNLKASSETLNQRRTLLKKVGVAAPVVVTLASRPAYGAGFCSLSGFASVNASGVLRHQNQKCGGFSQGGWKTAYGNGDGNWATENVGVNPNPESESKFSNLTKLQDAIDEYEQYNDCVMNGLGNCGDAPYNVLGNRMANSTTPFSGVFQFPPVPQAGAWPTNSGYVVSLHDGLLYGDEKTREAVAAYLNANADSRIDFHFTAAQVVGLFDGGFTFTNGIRVPSSGTLSDADVIALFQSAQH